ncbi:type III PLP-dependent enzyme domain-containing protein [Ureibacillus manganicus]|uniref:pyridoxal-dependent decarboxylase n=1 Tax=Ureibacillus manganicus TaxID=1266064 RepID=UPI00056BE3EE|nr:pyridoxal-dependent decarboxylase [Ureibacillus manganicus]
MENQKMTYDTLPTPYFLIDESELETNIRNLKDALSTYWDNSIIGYSFKTNSVPWLLKYFKDQGLYAEVVSDDEYDMAKAVNYSKDKIIYNGVAKSKETFKEALQNHCIVNIDSHRELDWLKELNDATCDEVFEIGIRVNFNLEKYCPDETVMGVEGSRFGFCYENGELLKAINFINSLKYIRLTGLHLHNSTKTRSLNIYRALSKIACEIKKVYSLNLKYVDIGGGFFGGLEDKPKFADYLECIEAELSKEFSPTETVLIVEPGISLVGSPIRYISSVIDVNETSQNLFIITDGSTININPLKNKEIQYFSIEKNCQSQRKVVDKQVVSGFTCMEDDWIFVLEESPKLKVGDKIIYEKIGGYSLSLSPLFIKYFPAIYVEKDGVITKVSERWTSTQLVNANDFEE